MNTKQESEQAVIRAAKRLIDSKRELMDAKKRRTHAITEYAKAYGIPRECAGRRKIDETKDWIYNINHLYAGQKIYGEDTPCFFVSSAKGSLGAAVRTVLPGGVFYVETINNYEDSGETEWEDDVREEMSRLGYVDGEVSTRKNEVDKAVKALRRAVDSYDNIVNKI